MFFILLFSKQVKKGQSATFAIKSLNRKIILKRTSFRKGMVLIDGVPREHAGLPVRYSVYEKVTYLPMFIMDLIYGLICIIHSILSLCNSVVYV